MSDNFFELSIWDLAPMSAPRPRFGSNKVYMDSQYISYKQIIAAEAVNRQNHLILRDNYKPCDVFFATPTRMSISFFFKIGKSKSVANNLGNPCVNQMDIDNLSKGVMDALQGVLYKNDNIITSLSASKLYGHPQGIVISLSSKIY